jgi:N-acetyl-1-D-myo-inositol-2-amino-2-deoxy-alpha-D-glucopyranoside deacetylase
VRPRPSAIEVLVGVPIAAVVGFLVGTLGTFKHQAGVSAVTGGGFPIGLLLSLAMIAAVLAALRVAFDGRLYAVAAGIGVVAAVALFDLPGPGGSRVVIGNAEGIVWMVGPALIAVAAAVLPGRSRAGSLRADGILETDTEEEDPAL